MLKSKSFETFIGTMRSLEQAGAGLEKLVAHSLQQATPSESALLAWPVVCGSVVADRTRALGFQDGVLRVEVADAGWKSELQALAPRYLAAINRYTREAVRRIEFVAARATRQDVTSHSSTRS
jgi:predicted nucleic acid-binding Zn ribbon protein